MKIVFPAIWLSGFGWYTFKSLSTPIFSPDRWVELLILISGLIIFWYLAFRLKEVFIDENNLYISNYGREIIVPLNQAINVTENLLTRPMQITIWLAETKSFGKKIIFTPKMTGYNFENHHPIFDELQQLIVKKV